ncbi:MAG: hypothetical protein WAV05_14890 [Anaerolineales bacterium]
MDLEHILPKPDLFSARVVLAIQLHYDDNDINAGGSITSLVEQDEAGKLIGVKGQYWLDFPNAGPFDHFEVRRGIIQHIRLLHGVGETWKYYT